MEDVTHVVRQRRVHFETECEWVDGQSRRTAAGWTVRLFALHDKGAHLVPGCPSCQRLALDLERLAAGALCDGELDAHVDVGVLKPALYQSRALPGRDEVALAVRVWPRDGASPARGADGACVREVRRRLRRLGVAES